MTARGSLAVRWRSRAPEILSAVRMTSALLFMHVGSAKLFAVPVAIMPGGGTAAAGSLAWVAGVLEVGGGLLLFAGLWTRSVAFVLSGEMAVAYFKGHAPRGFWPVVNMGQPAILFCLLWLYLSAAGAGPWSIDALRERSPAASRR